MNKTEFIKELSKETGYDEYRCIFGRKNKDKIIKDLQKEVSLSEDDAENTYDISIKIITKEIKNKIKHSFKS